jgi:hypothetical protein
MTPSEMSKVVEEAEEESGRFERRRGPIPDMTAEERHEVTTKQYFSYSNFKNKNYQHIFKTDW